jgi:hypothetical protein
MFDQAPEDCVESGLLAGTAWAMQNGYPAHGPSGAEFKLCSPIDAVARATRMHADDRVIEEYLYHSRHHGNSVAMLLRKAIMASIGSWQDDECDGDRGALSDGEGGLQDNFLTLEDCRSWCMELFAVTFDSTSGAASVRQRNKRWSEAAACHTGAVKSRWKLSPCVWPIFIRCLDGEGEVEGYRLHDIIIKFAGNFRTEMSRQPPLHTRKELEDFVEQNLNTHPNEL